MNVLLMNRDGFVTPADGWYQIAPVGEFPHAQAGVTQVVDAEACAAMANRFAEEAKAPNFAGLLVDFDHFSLDGEKASEAAGWITGLEMRNSECGARSGDASRGGVEAQGGSGLWAKIRWSDVGESAVKGGRYRFLSPVWNRADCVDLGDGRVRPVRLLNAAVTNDPNFKGMQPLSNRGQSSDVSGQGVGTSTAKGATDAKSEIANAAPPAEPRFKWTLGDTDKGHCPSCAAMVGQVHTMPEWEASGVTPGAGGLFCQGTCKCSLDPTDEPSGGAVVAGPMRRIANTGWTDAARAASLAVRQARAKGRGTPARSATAGRSGGSAGGCSGASGASHDRASDPSASDTRASDEAAAEQAAHEKAADEKEHQDTPDSAPTGGRAARAAARQAASLEAASADVEATYEKVGLSGMTRTEVNTMTARIGRKVRNGTELSPTEKSFLAAVGAKKQVTNRRPGLDVRGSIVRKVRAGVALTSAEERFLTSKG